MTDFKKAMFEKHIEKLDELKPVSITWKGQSVQIDNFEKINQLMSQAVEDDLKNVQEVPGGWNNMRAEATQVEQLKKAIFIAYINDTDDFKESIYNEKAQVKSILYLLIKMQQMQQELWQLKNLNMVKNKFYQKINLRELDMIL